MKNVKKNKKIVITDPKLKDYGKEFYLSHNLEDSDIWSYSKKRGDAICAGNAKLSQFTLCDNGSGYKSHMLFFSEDEFFTTYCGINESCSEKFYENVSLYPPYDYRLVNCKRCLKAFKGDYEWSINQEKFLKYINLEEE